MEVNPSFESLPWLVQRAIDARNRSLTSNAQDQIAAHRDLLEVWHDYLERSRELRSAFCDEVAGYFFSDTRFDPSKDDFAADSVIRSLAFSGPDPISLQLNLQLLKRHGAAPVNLIFTGLRHVAQYACSSSFGAPVFLYQEQLGLGNIVGDMLFEDEGFLRYFAIVRTGVLLQIEASEVRVEDATPVVSQRKHRS